MVFIKRPTGEIDILIGLDFASFHPCMIQYHGHLMIYENRFGRCLGGTHTSIREDIKNDDLPCYSKSCTCK